MSDLGIDPTPFSLLERLRRFNSREDWNRFVELYTPLLLLYAKKLCVREHAGDVVQDVFTAVVANMPTFQYDPAKRFRGWLWVIFTQRAGEHRKRNPVPIGTIDSQNEPYQTDIDILTEEEHKHFLLARALKLIQRDFSTEVWEIFRAYVLEDRAADEVARRFGKTTSDIYAVKYRVLRHLRKEFRDLIED